MLTCRTCGENKEQELFSKHKNRDGSYSYNHCKICNALMQKISRQKNQIAYNRKAQLKRNERKLRAIEYKGSRCLDCGEKYHQAAFDFHHRNPAEKHTDPGLMMGLIDEKLFLELDKCDLLCANCHRVRHFNEN